MTPISLIFLGAVSFLAVNSFLAARKNRKLFYDVESIPKEGNAHFLIMIGYYWEGKYRYDIHPNFRNFQRVAKKAKHVVGFNSLSFDDNVCKDNGIKVKTTYDLYKEVITAVKSQSKHGNISGYKLEDLAQANLGKGKIQNEKTIGTLWNQGKIEELAEYCLMDVQLTKKLYERRKKIKDPNDKKKFLILRD